MRKDSDRPPDEQPEKRCFYGARKPGGDPPVGLRNRGNVDLQSVGRAGKFGKLLRSDPRPGLVVVVPGVSVV